MSQFLQVIGPYLKMNAGCSSRSRSGRRRNHRLKPWRPFIGIVSVYISYRRMLTTHLSSPPSIEVLYRIRKERPDVFDKLEGKSCDHITLYLISSTSTTSLHGWRCSKRNRRGGILRSVCTSNISVDILKALCLGAKAVGLGRPYLYAQSVCTVYVITPE